MPAPSLDQWIVPKPPRILAGRRQEIAEMAGWEIRETNGDRRVRTREAHHHQTPRLLTSRHIPTGQYAFLATLPEQSAELTALAERWTDRGLQGLRTQDTFPSKVAQFQLISLRTPTARLPHELGAFFTAATEFLPDSELLALDLAPQLSGRYTFAELLLNAQFAPHQLNATGYSPATRRP